MSAWDDRTLDPEEIGVRAPIQGVAAEETIVADDLQRVACPFCGHSPHGAITCAVVIPCCTDETCREAEHLCACSYPNPDNYAEVPSVGIDFFWRQVGTDIEVRVRPDFLASGPAWQHQYAPTGLLTIHLAGNPADAEPVREVPDPLEPIETPGPTFVRQAEWDDATQTWRTPDAGPHETYVTGPVGGHWIWKCRQCSASAGHGFRSVAEAEAEEHRKENAR